MDQRFDATRLPDRRDVAAPDGSDVRVLLQLDRGGMAHSELGAGRTSRAVASAGLRERRYVFSGPRPVLSRASRIETPSAKPVEE